MISLYTNIRTKAQRMLSAEVLVSLSYLVSCRAARAEDRVDVKTLYYVEDGDRMSVFAPSVLVEKEISATTKIHVEGIYNIISGMSPTGAPAQSQTITTRIPQYTPVTTTTVTPSATVTVYRDDDDHDEHEDDHDGFIRTIPAAFYAGAAGATPVAAPAPAPAVTTTAATPVSTSQSAGNATYQEVINQTTETRVPTAKADDTRIGFNIGLVKQHGRHTVDTTFSYSDESDYTSYGISISDAIDFNQKNTTLTLGLGLNMDEVSGYFLNGSESKDTVDVMVGISQLLDRKTLLKANLTLGQLSGYLTDPYKVVELNGAIVGEKRPDSKSKEIIYVSLTRYIESLGASVEGGFRYYNDDFGISSQTITLAWFQELGEHWMIRPYTRFYSQSAADFYDVRFTGSPENYSSDYRVSELDATGYGLQFIWHPKENISLDLAIDRYSQKGKDGVTWSDVYPSATSYILGVRWWF